MEDLTEKLNSLLGDPEIMDKIQNLLEKGTFFSMDNFSEDEIPFVKNLHLLCSKPVIYAANVKDEDLADEGATNSFVKEVKELAEKEGSEVFVISAQIEQEIAELDEEDKKEFLEELGLTEGGLEKLIRASYSLLGLISKILLAFA